MVVACDWGGCLRAGTSISTRTFDGDTFHAQHGYAGIFLQRGLTIGLLCSNTEAFFLCYLECVGFVDKDQASVIAVNMRGRVKKLDTTLTIDHTNVVILVNEDNGLLAAIILA